MPWAALIGAALGLAASIWGAHNSNKEAKRNEAFAKEQVGILQDFRPIVLANASLARVESFMWEYRAPLHRQIASILGEKADATLLEAETLRAKADVHLFGVAIEASILEEQAHDALVEGRLRVSEIVKGERLSTSAARAHAAGSGFALEDADYSDFRREAIANSMMVLDQSHRKSAQLTTAAARKNTEYALIDSEASLDAQKLRITSNEQLFEADNARLEAMNARIRAGQARTRAGEILMDFKSQLSAAQHGIAVATLQKSNNLVGSWISTAQAGFQVADAWQDLWKSDS